MGDREPPALGRLWIFPPGMNLIQKTRRTPGKAQCCAKLGLGSGEDAPVLGSPRIPRDKVSAWDGGSGGPPAAALRGSGGPASLPGLAAGIAPGIPRNRGRL